MFFYTIHIQPVFHNYKFIGILYISKMMIR